MDSGVMQALVPLAAAGVSAWSPRYGGAAVQGGIGAMRAMNDRKMDNMRLSELQKKNEAEQAAAAEKRNAWGSLVKRLSPQQKYDDARMGGVSGDAPAATEMAKSNAFESTGAPTPRGFSGISQEQADLLSVMDQEQGAKLLAQWMGQKGPEQKQPDPHFSEFTTPEGDRVQNITRIRPDGVPNQVQMLLGSVAPPQGNDPKYIDWGYGQKKKINPDGSESIEKVPTAPRETGVGGGLLGKHSPEEIKLLADAIENGRQVPDFKALYGAGAPLKAELEKRGINVWRLQRDADAIKRHTNTMNGQQMVRLNQTIDFADHSLDQIEELYDKWNKTGYATQFKGFNKMALAVAANTGGDAGAIAQTLMAQIGDLTSELGTIYKGGNASTDESLKLAAQNLNGSWNEKTFAAAIKAIRRNMAMRKDAMSNVQAFGVQPNSPFAIQNQQGGAQTAPSSNRPPLSSFERP